MSDSDEQAESILGNLNKTRKLWSSKADLGTTNYLIPKSPTTPTPNKKSQPESLQNGSAPIEVVREDDEVVEEYELPDIKSMRSQWEVSNSQPLPVPLPTNKSPAVIAREKSIKVKAKDKPPPEIVNREESPEEEHYEVELTKLKAQFESAARAASKTRPKSPKAPMPKTVIKEQVHKSSLKRNSSRSFNKKLRFEDEMSAPGAKVQTEQRTESEQISVDLSGIKSQFESRKDEHLVTPQLSVKRTQEKSTSQRTAIVTTSKDDKTESDGSASPRIEPVKSSEPIYDEMVGEESVKDRLQRYKSMTETTSNVRKISVERKVSQKKQSAPVVRRDSVNSEETKEEEKEPKQDVVRSPPAGTREQPDYVPSVDLRQTKALFETSDSKSSVGIKRRNSSRSSTSSTSSRSPARSVRSSSRSSRSSSHHTSPSPSRRSKSPVLSDRPASPTSSEMSDIVKPPPAGTKENADYVPSVKISSLKSMFEKSKNTSSNASAEPPRRRQLRDADWANGNESEARKDSSESKVVVEGSYENREGGVVRPPTAGTKERPGYSLSSDFLKSRAAMFDSPQPKEYAPRNKVSVKNVGAPTDVVNAQGNEQTDLNYELSNSLKDTKKMFENGGASADKPTPTQRRSDIVPAADLSSAKSKFENQETQEEPVRKEPIDIQQEVAETQQEEEQPSEEDDLPSEAPDPEEEQEESESEGEYTLENNTEHVAEEAAAVTPVRVAVPEPEEPADDSSEKDYVKEEKDYPSEDVDQYDNDVPDLVAQGHEVQNEEPEEQEEEEQAPEDPVQEEEPQQEEAEAEQAPNGDEEPTEANVEPAYDEEQEPEAQAEDDQEVGDLIAQKQEEGDEETTDNGLEPAQEAGRSLPDVGSHSDDSDDYDKPHFHYVYEETVDGKNKGSDFEDALLLDTSTSQAPTNGVDLLNGFSGENLNGSPSPSDTAGAAMPQSADPFDIFAPAPTKTTKTPMAPDPFDIFAPASTNPANGDVISKDPFDLFS